MTAAGAMAAGAAAQILARHPDWGPDQVKGALMLTAAYLPYVDWQAAGTGEVDAALAASLVDTPPNPNENLDAFVDLVAKILSTPSFLPEELARLQRETVAEIIEARDSDRALVPC